MITRTTIAVLAAATAAAVALPSAAQVSRYTPLGGPPCRERAVDPEDPVDGGGRVCPGLGGYSLEIQTGDDRDFVSIVDRRGREYDLRLTETVTGAFSWTGPRAEWRLRGRRPEPYALIFRLGHQREDGIRNTSVLVVARLDRMCVTAVIPAGPQQNERARAAADRPGRCRSVTD